MGILCRSLFHLLKNDLTTKITPKCSPQLLFQRLIHFNFQPEIAPSNLGKLIEVINFSN